MEAYLKKKIDALEKAKLETELYSKMMNLLLFNIPPATSPTADTEAVLREYLSSVGLPKYYVICKLP